MYTNGNFESHLAALLFLGTLALQLLLCVVTMVLFFARRKWVRYSLLAMAALLVGYGLLLATFSFTSGESYETTWVFDVPKNAQSLRMLAELRGFPTYVLIGTKPARGMG